VHHSASIAAENCIPREDPKAAQLDAPLRLSDVQLVQPRIQFKLAAELDPAEGCRPLSLPFKWRIFVEPHLQRTRTRRKDFTRKRDFGACM
jgi:hypothetical protein